MKLIEIALSGLLLANIIVGQEQAVVNSARRVSDSSELSARLAAIERAMENNPKLFPVTLKQASQGASAAPR